MLNTFSQIVHSAVLFKLLLNLSTFPFLCLLVSQEGMQWLVTS